MKNDANIRNFIEISGNMHGKSRKMRGKSGNFGGIHSTRWKNRREILRSFPVIFAVVSGHFRSFLVIIPIDSAESFRFVPNDSFLFRFIPFSFLNPLFYALKHKKVIYFKISRFFFGGSNYSSYFCRRL